MENYLMENFKIGDVVFHSSSKNFLMTIFGKDDVKNEIKCGLISSDGNIINLEFKPEELRIYKNKKELSGTL